MITIFEINKPRNNFHPRIYFAIFLKLNFFGVNIFKIILIFSHLKKSPKTQFNSQQTNADVKARNPFLSKKTNIKNAKCNRKRPSHLPITPMTELKVGRMHKKNLFENLISKNFPSNFPAVAQLKSYLFGKTPVKIQTKTPKTIKFSNQFASHRQ